MKTFRLVLLALACSAPLVASAQWVWQGNDGRKVFSDRPPPADVPANRILKQPGQRGGAAGLAAGTATMDGGTVNEVATAPAAAPAAAAPKLAGKDKDLEEKRKQLAAAEAEKKKAAEEQYAQQRADNCKRARTAKATYESGIRVARTNDKGEREILDDKDREADIKRLDSIIGRDCTPLASAQ
jgi:hypothetical protein